ncbi:glycosyltransferase [uncultured Clostridium sp.]|uniref:glycosyltransferase n=1 Tax=uncultured Clostridium sp. TaxID=59620 RepID=UPI0026313124|nr:glycosyltransferase [uncultured Clostridium sp.]
MNITIICPLYNASGYIRDLNEKLLDQKVDKEYKIFIKYILTESKDNTENILKELESNYKKITAKEFSHSQTREKAAMELENNNIIVFISQDIKIKDDKWLENLVNPIIEGECEASFSRQLPENETIEKYIREKNYPATSRVVSKADIAKMGLLTFFYSDASSAVRDDVYRKVKGYDNKRLLINEDMYLAEKLITSGYKIKYCSDSEVYHSHTFTLKELYKRYFDTGVFFKQNSQFLKYKSSESGLAMAKHALKRSIEEKNYKVTINIMPNFAARLIGSQLGKRYNNLSKIIVNKSSLSKKVYGE